jgi:hypothetical protein
LIRELYLDERVVNKSDTGIYQQQDRQTPGTNIPSTISFIRRIIVEQKVLRWEGAHKYGKNGSRCEEVDALALQNLEQRNTEMQKVPAREEINATKFRKLE